jgi:hypothetical protein
MENVIDLGFHGNNMSFMVFCDVTSCNSETAPRYRGIYLFHPQDRRIIGENFQENMHQLIACIEETPSLKCTTGLIRYNARIIGES